MLCGASSAQPAATSVGVLRETSDATPQSLVDAADAALLRDLSAIAGIESPVVSPVDYAEIELGVGCSDDSRACLAAIARAVRVDALVVRRLSVHADGGGRLELIYFEAASTDAPAKVRLDAAPAWMQADLVAGVPSLVRRLFGVPEVAAPADATPIPPAEPVATPKTAHARMSTGDDVSGVSAVTWIALGTGAAALTAGIIVGWTAEQDFGRWKQMPVRNRDEADDARAAFDDLRNRAIAADILLPVGAIAVGLGVTLLVLDLGRGAEPEAGQARLTVEPSAGGAMLHVAGELGNAF
jgi:hypothetical protein